MRFTTAMLEAPRTVDPGRVVPGPGDRLERLLERRELQRGSFQWRAKTWESSRPADAGPVEFPRDQAAVIALGVPCVDCLVLVFEQGQCGGDLDDDELGAGAIAAMPAAHRVSFGIIPGQHWSRFVAARCHR